MSAIPATAGAVGELKFDNCLTGGGTVGCVNVPSLGLANPGPVAVAPSGSVYVGAAQLNSVAHFFAASNGQLAFDGCVSDNGSGGGCTDIPASGLPLRGLTDVAAGPDGSVYASSQNGTVSHFFADPGGQIRWDGCVSNDGLTDDGNGGSSITTCTDLPGAGTPLTGAQSLAAAPGGGSLYVASNSRNSVSHFFVAPGGQITFGGCVSGDGSGGFCTDVLGAADPLAFVASVSVAPSGDVYTGASTTVAHFSAAPAGQITFADCLSNDGSGGTCTDIPGAGSPLVVPAVTTASTGAVYAASGQGGFDISHLFAGLGGPMAFDACASNEGSGGTCADIPGAPFEKGNASLAASPDGRSLYVVGKDSVVAFTMAAGGQLAFQACYGNDASRGCVDLPGAPIKGANDVAVSPDGGSVYVTSSDAKSITHFFRTVTAGAGTAPGGGGGAGTGARCAGRAATLVGTPGDDRLTGTAKADVIVGLGGKDRIRGLAGNDRICGGAGKDQLSGGTGADVLSGGVGDDILRGGAGKDRLLGGGGRDRLLGGAARDVLVGGAGRNVLVPGPQR